MFDSSLVFASLPEGSKRRLARVASTHRWRRYAAVSSVGETTERFFLIQSGSVEVRRSRNDPSRHLTLYLLEPGDGFDLLTLLDGRPHDVARRALSAVEAVSFPRSEVLAVMERNARMHRDVVNLVAARLRAVESVAEDLALHDTGARLARLILRLAAGSTDAAREIDLSDNELASMIGSVRTVVNRQLRALRNAGILEKGPNGLLVRNLQRLKEQCEAGTG